MSIPLTDFENSVQIDP